MNADRQIERSVRRAGRELRRCGVPRSRRVELASELELDLRDAADRGRAPTEALGGDPAGFARSWARASGLNATPRRLMLLVGVVMVGPALVALATYVLIGGGETLGLPTFDIVMKDKALRDTDPSPGAILAIMGGAAALGYLAALALAGLALVLVGDDRLQATVRRLAWAIPTGFLGGTLSAMFYAYIVDYSTEVVHIFLEAALAAAVVAAATVTARRFALRRPETQPAGAAAALT